MAQANTPHLISMAPELYDGQGNKALAFWNILENYFTVNEDTFNTDHKKVASALTYFKQDTQAGEWASNQMATAGGLLEPRPPPGAVFPRLKPGQGEA